MPYKYYLVYIYVFFYACDVHDFYNICDVYDIRYIHDIMKYVISITSMIYIIYIDTYGLFISNIYNFAYEKESMINKIFFGT